MTELFIRALFILACAAIGLQVSEFRGREEQLWGILSGLSVAMILIALEMVLSKRPIQSISAIVFGIITGCLLAILFFFILRLATTQDFITQLGFANESQFLFVSGLSLAVTCCYLCTMVIYKTRDRFRFIIPYVEFQKEEKGARPVLIDTSAIIDGRLSELCDTRVFDTMLIVPKFVLQELQHVADSGDRLRRNRGRRGLEMLQLLQRDERVAIQIHDGRSARGSTVDSKLVSLASQLQAKILTCDYNLTKIAELQNVDTININDLANALRPAVMSGEEMVLKIIRPGDEPAQGVGYLNDGTMVVVEQGRQRIGQTVNVVVTNTLQTNAGRMVFARLRQDPAGRANHSNEREQKGQPEQGT